MIKIENGVQIETFGDSNILSLGVPKAIKDYQSYAVSLGFTRMAKNIDLRLADGDLSPYKALTAQEHRNLRRHFPCDYWVSDQRSTMISGYAFDTIPLGVLKIIDRARRSELFDGIYIRTPERARISDPVLMGIAGDQVFLLARWGEALQPLEYFIGRQTLSQRWATTEDKVPIIALASFLFIVAMMILSTITG